MRMSKLNADQVADEARTAPGWSVQGDEIKREYEFADFVQAIGFVNRLADAAQAMNHHPDIDIRYNKVALALTTHDSGGLTSNDFTLARRADQVFAGG